MMSPKPRWSIATMATKTTIAYIASRPKSAASGMSRLLQYAVTDMPMKRAKYAPNARITMATITLGTNSTTRTTSSVTAIRPTLFEAIISAVRMVSQ